MYIPSIRLFWGLLGLFLPLATYATPRLVITKIDACATSDAEWIEVYNQSESTLDLSEWRFFEQGSNHTLKALEGQNTQLIPNSSTVIVDNPTAFSEKYPQYTGPIIDSSWGSLKNSGEEIGMKNETGAEEEPFFTYPKCESDTFLARVGHDNNPSQTENWILQPLSEAFLSFDPPQSEPEAEVPDTETETETNPSKQEGSPESSVPEETTEEEIPQEEAPKEEEEPLTIPIQEPALEEEAVDSEPDPIEADGGPVPTFTVQITEIQPVTIGTEEEWFEFVITPTQNDPIDLSTWSIQNGKGTKKPFIEAKDALKTNQVIGWAPETQVWTPNSEPAYFFFAPSPLTLSNGGSTIQLYQNDQLLTQITYPSTKNGTTNGKKWAETWNFAPNTQQLVPLITQQDHDQLIHSQGLSSLNFPAAPDHVQLQVNQIKSNPGSPDQIDEIKLTITHSSEKQANLKYLEILHNGTTLVWIETDFYVREGEELKLQFGLPFSGIAETPTGYLLTTDKRGGLVQSGGTVEVRLFGSTSHETTEDFVCWGEELTASEQERVSNAQDQDHWSGNCLLPPDQEGTYLQRKEGNPDTNTKEDFETSLPTKEETVIPTAVLAPVPKATGSAPTFNRRALKDWLKAQLHDFVSQKKAEQVKSLSFYQSFLSRLTPVAKQLLVERARAFWKAEALRDSSYKGYTFQDGLHSE